MIAKQNTSPLNLSSIFAKLWYYGHLEILQYLFQKYEEGIIIIDVYIHSEMSFLEAIRPINIHINQKCLDIPATSNLQTTAFHHACSQGIF